MDLQAPERARGPFPLFDVTDVIRFQTLVGKLDAQSRLQLNDSQPLTLYLRSTGSDSNDGKTADTAVLTIDRVRQLCQEYNASIVTVDVGAGTFTVPAYFGRLNYISFTGINVVEEASVPISAVTVQSNDNQLQVTVTRTPTLSDDEWEGKLVAFNDAGSLAYGYVHGNIGNTVYITASNFDLSSNPVTTSSTIDIIDQQTNFQLVQGNNAFTGSTQVYFTDIKVTGTAQGRVPYFINTDKWEYSRCYIAVNRPQIGIGGAANLYGCYIRSLGDSVNGVLAAVRNGFLRIGRGTVISAAGAGAGEEFIYIAKNSIVEFDGQITVRDLSSDGFKVEGGLHFVDGGVGNTDNILFYEPSGTPTCAGAFNYNADSEGLEGGGQLPRLSGSVSSARSIVGQRGAKVRAPATSTLTDTTGTLTVSADGGATDSSRAIDGTDITGGSPLRSAKWNGFTQVDSASVTTHTADETDNLIECDTGTAAITVNLPDATSLQPGSGYDIKNKTGGSFNVTIDPNGSQTIEGLASLTLAPAENATMYTDGANWFIH